MPASNATDAGQESWTFKTEVHFRRGGRGRKHLREGDAPEPVPTVPGRVPRVARLLALAHRFEKLVGAGDVRDYADLARLSGVTRARITQIMNLLLLAPDIQEAILDLPRTLAGSETITERHLRAIVGEPLWSKQRALWQEMTTGSDGLSSRMPPAAVR